MAKDTVEVNIQADVMTYFQAVFEQGIIYGQLWDYLQRELAKINCAMETEDDNDGISHYYFLVKPYKVTYNSEFELIVRAIRELSGKPHES